MQILYQDENIIVCIKPIGIDSENRLPELLSNELGSEVYTLHRLDLNVGGIMIYAKNKKTAAEISAIIQSGNMIKEYVACVHGYPPESDHWEDILFKDSHKNKVFVINNLRRGAKKASLEFKRTQADKETDTSLVRIRLHTGRSHQIRVQFASRGFPLVGDGKYGARDKHKNPMLFSCMLSFKYKDKICRYEALPEWYITSEQ